MSLAEQLRAYRDTTRPGRDCADDDATPRPGTFQLILAWMRLWGFRAVKLLIGAGYVAVITEGLRMVVPALGIKLHKLPLLGVLKGYEGWHQLDLALFGGMLLFAFSSSIWCALLERWLYEDLTASSSDRAGTTYQSCLTAVGVVILFSDACLFYRAMTFVGWGGQAFSLTALLGTLAYVAVLVAVCMTSVNLKRDYVSLKRACA